MVATQSPPYTVASPKLYTGSFMNQRCAGARWPASLLAASEWPHHLQIEVEAAEPRLSRALSAHLSAVDETERKAFQ
jgi:hypothetical protein